MRVDAGGDRIVTGIAIPFNQQSVNLGGFVEQFAPSAVDYTLRNVDVRALSGHDTVRLLARLTAGTLRLTKDRTGLQFQIALPDTTDGRDVYELVRRRDLTGASFGFSIVNGGETWDFTGALPLRTVRDARINEISLVAWPAYPSTTAQLKRTTPSGMSIALAEKKNRLARAR